MGFLVILPEWKTISFRKLVTAASPPYGIRTFCYPSPTASLFGSVTWEDAGGMAAVFMSIGAGTIARGDPNYASGLCFWTV